jgi:glycine/D-amino acid oxidase-like deaminating enzyme
MNEPSPRWSWPGSLWASVTPAAEPLPALEGEVDADLVVIGAGFTGLTAALHAVEQGRRVVVLEAAAPGFGASGRTNGQVIPTLSRPDPEDLIARWGDAGERFVHLLRDSANHLFSQVKRLGIDCEAEQAGWVQPAHSPGRLKISERRVRQWSRYGADVALLTRQEARDLIGSDTWFGGWTARSGGHINPLAFTRGLAGAVRAKGGTIHADTPVGELTHDGERWVAVGPRGRVRAHAAVLATHAYTGEFAPGLAAGLAREVVPVHSFQMATQPLGDDLRGLILPQRTSLSDTHGDLHFARYDARHRLISGGALLSPANAEHKLRPMIAARLRKMFPQIGEVRFDYIWYGFIGMTDDYHPRVHQIGPNGFAWAGCNGRGIALSVSMGRELARAALGEDVRGLALPIEPIRPVPFHALARRVGPLKLILYRWRDAREI